MKSLIELFQFYEFIIYKFALILQLLAPLYTQFSLTNLLLTNNLIAYSFGLIIFIVSNKYDSAQIIVYTVFLLKYEENSAIAF